MKDEYDEYKDIINLPRHTSEKRLPMPIENRAAQFSPFAALTGFDSAVKETARTTEKKVGLDRYIKEKLNRKLQILIQNIKKEPEITITYFKPDGKKDGGAYITEKGKIKKIDEYKKNIIITDDIVIPIEEIIKIEGEIFKTLMPD